MAPFRAEFLDHNTKDEFWSDWVRPGATHCDFRLGSFGNGRTATTWLRPTGHRQLTISVSFAPFTIIPVSCNSPGGILAIFFKIFLKPRQSLRLSYPAVSFTTFGSCSEGRSLCSIAANSHAAPPAAVPMALVEKQKR